MNRTAIENALTAWVKAATSFAAGKVVLSEQGGTAPLSGMVSIRIGDTRDIAPQVELLDETDLNRPAGTEVRFTAKAFKEFSVTLQAFTDATTGASTALAKLTACQSYLGLPSTKALFEAADISCFDPGVVQNLTAVSHAVFEGRAVLTLRFYGLDEVTEDAGYIATVELEDFTGPPLGDTDEIDIP